MHYQGEKRETRTSYWMLVRHNSTRDGFWSDVVVRVGFWSDLIVHAGDLDLNGR
jgi:hypothetical protein